MRVVRSASKPAYNNITDGRWMDVGCNFQSEGSESCLLNLSSAPRASTAFAGAMIIGGRREGAGRRTATAAQRAGGISTKHDEKIISRRRCGWRLAIVAKCGTSHPILSISPSTSTAAAGNQLNAANEEPAHPHRRSDLRSDHTEMLPQLQLLVPVTHRRHRGRKHAWFGRGKSIRHRVNPSIAIGASTTTSPSPPPPPSPL